MTPSCGACGHPLRVGAQFCTTCGARVPQAPPAPASPEPRWSADPTGPAVPGPGWAPPPPGSRPGRRTSLPVLIAVVVLAVGLLAGGAVYLFRAPAPVGQSSSSTRSAVAPSPAAPVAPAESRRPPPPVAPVSRSPGERLDAVVAADRPLAESLVGRWVPQIASKQVGTVDAAGVTFDEAAILAEVEAFKARFSQAVVVRSDEFTSFRRPGFWVTLVAVPSAGADGANAWCAANGFAPGDCFAKRLSHTEGPQGNTVPR